MNRVDKQERTQRIRYGLTGLAVVFLFVLLVDAVHRPRLFALSFHCNEA